MKRIIALLLLGLAGSVSSFAQTAMTQTTITGAITSNQTTFQVASATGIVGPSYVGNPTQTPGSATLLVIDNEAMFVRGISGTLVTVQRGASGTVATAHNAASVVWAGNPNLYLSADPSGSCTVANTTNPTIVTTNAYRVQSHFWNCVNSNWQPVFTTGTITPTAVTTATTSSQTFTVHGLAAGELIDMVSGPTPASGCALVGATVTAANTLSLQFANPTTSSCTPTAGAYYFFIPRFSL